MGGDSDEDRTRRIARSLLTSYRAALAAALAPPNTGMSDKKHYPQLFAQQLFANPDHNPLIQNSINSVAMLQEVRNESERQEGGAQNSATENHLDFVYLVSLMAARYAESRNRRRNRTSAGDGLERGEKGVDEDGGEIEGGGGAVGRGEVPPDDGVATGVLHRTQSAIINEKELAKRIVNNAGDAEAIRNEEEADMVMSVAALAAAEEIPAQTLKDWLYSNVTEEHAARYIDHLSTLGINADDTDASHVFTVLPFTRTSTFWEFPHGLIAIIEEDAAFQETLEARIKVVTRNVIRSKRPMRHAVQKPWIRLLSTAEGQKPNAAACATSIASNDTCGIARHCVSTDGGSLLIYSVSAVSHLLRAMYRPGLCRIPSEQGGQGGEGTDGGGEGAEVQGQDAESTSPVSNAGIDPSMSMAIVEGVEKDIEDAKQSLYQSRILRAKIGNQQGRSVPHILRPKVEPKVNPDTWKDLIDWTVPKPTGVAFPGHPGDVKAATEGD